MKGTKTKKKQKNTKKCQKCPGRLVSSVSISDFLRGGLVGNFGNAINTSPSQVFVEIQAKGETLDGQNVESEVMVYPISVCDGCGVFDRTLSFCCDNPDSPDTSGCPTFGAPPMCLPGD